MRLSVVFELLLVFLFLAFAAARVLDPAKTTKNLANGNKKTTTLRQGPPNRYCACTSRMCNCCRDFSLPVVPLKGPGCASIMYVQRDTMMVTMSFGDRVLSNTTISGKTPKPICMALPGGISQFCGRIYGISRKGDQFRACLGLELRALDDIEAALRVSCFKFGPKGVRLESAPPVPEESGNKDPEDEDEDDYDLDDDEDDDLIGFGVGDEDDDGSSEDNEVDSDSVDYTGFSVLGEDILGTLFSDDTGSSGTKKKSPNKKTVKPQAVVLKTSTTTRKPIFPIRKKSTVRPLLSPTKRPLVNRITRRPISTVQPQIVKRPTQTVTITPQSTVHSTYVPSVSPAVNKNIIEQITKTNKPVTTEKYPVKAETFSTTMRVPTVTESQVSDKIFSEPPVVSQTEQSVTFTAPTVQTEVVKNEIKLPLTDLEKLEAVAAIAQQDVTSGFVSSDSLSSAEAEERPETITTKYEKITPIILDSSTKYTSGNMEKINSVKFVPTTVVTSRPSAELINHDDLLEEIVNYEIVNNSESAEVKNTSANHPITELTPGKEESYDMTESEETVDNSKTEQNSVNENNNVTTNLKKQPVKNKPAKEEGEDEEEDEEEDLLEGVLSDDDDVDDDESDNEEVEEDESDTRPSSTNKDKNQAASDKEEEDDDEDDLLGEAEETSEEKPTKVTIKKKPPKENDEKEEEEEEEDILDVLGDDVDEEEEEEDEEEESDDDEDSEKPIKKKTTTQATTIRTKIPTTQEMVHTRKPVATTEKIVSTTPKVQATATVTEKVILYQKPNEQQTEKVIFYQGPESQFPNKIFIYNDPENKISQETTHKIVIYNEPVTEKFVITKEEKIPNPIITPQLVADKNADDINSDSSEEDKLQNDSAESDEDSGAEKQTLMASIIKPGGFSNKYADHDLTENDDLDVEDTDGEDDNDFEEDRRLKQNQKKPTVKFTSKKPPVEANKPKLLTLNDLIKQNKKYHEQHNGNKPISTSRTHRRMNLDRFLQV